MNSAQNFPLEEIAFTRLENNADYPTIIFLHDSLGCIDLWRDFPKRLGERTHCNVIVYDRQGYGKSCGFTYPARDHAYMEFEADILHELIQYWKIDKAILFGHSDGGSISLIVAAKYPEKIIGIITEGAHILVEAVTVKGIKEAIGLYQNTDLKTRLAKYHGNKTDDMFWAWAGTWTKEAFRSWNIEDFLPAIACPAFIIQGEDDEYGTLRQVDGIVSQITGKATRLVIPKVHHTPHKEVPALVLGEAAKFIKEIQEQA